MSRFSVPPSGKSTGNVADLSAKSAHGRRSLLTLLAASFLLTFVAIRSATAIQSITDPVGGYTLSYPDDWTGYEALPGKPIELRNFPKERYATGQPPPGGANIYTSVLDPQSDPYVTLRDVVTRVGATDVKFSYSGPNNGRMRADATWELAGATYHLVYIAMVKSGKSFMLRLQYHVDDPHAPAYDKILTEVVNSIQIQAIKTPPVTQKTP